MKRRSTNECDGDDVDQDLETFLANKRRSRNKVASGAPTSGFVETGPLQLWQTPHSTATPTMPSPAEAATASRPLTAAVPSTSNDEVRERVIENNNDEYAFLNIANLDNPLEGEWYMPSPVCEEAARSESPLFVQQHDTNSNTNALHSRSAIQVNELLPRDYDSDSQFSGPKSVAPAPPLSHLVSGRQELKVNALRVGTMHNIFTQNGYAKAIKENPYTSGLFEYQGLSKEEIMSKPEYRDSISRQYRKPIQRKPKIAKTVRPQERLDLSDIGSPMSDLSSSAQRPAKKKTQTEVVNKSSSPASDEMMCYSITRDPSVGTTSTKGTGQDVQSPGRSDCNQNRSQLVDLLRNNAQFYEAALGQLECDIDTDSAHWRTLQSRISPQISSFIERLHNEQDLDVEDFKISLEAWDVDIGVQVIMQKYMMYTSLLKTI